MTKRDLSPLKSRIRDYLSARGVTYNPREKTYACPFHNDEHPSAVVYDNTHLLHCPVCNQNWDVFKIEEQLSGEHDFRKQIENVERILGMSATPISTDAPAPVKSKKTVVAPVAIPRDNIGEVYKAQKPFFAEVGTRSKWGELKKAWQYTDENNDIIVIDIRYESAAGEPGKEKVVMSWWYNGKTWQTKNYPVVIYNLYDAIHSTKPLLIVEGAKCARIGNENLSEWFTVISWNGGSGKAGLVDWSKISDKEIFILPDDDHKTYQKGHKLAGQEKPTEEQPGNRAAIEIQKQLPHAKIIKYVESARHIKDDGADIEEILQVMTAAELAGYILDRKNHIGHTTVAEPSETPPESAVAVLAVAPDSGGSAPLSVPSDTAARECDHFSGRPFKTLGIGDDGQAYFIGHDDRLYCEKLKSINRQFLRMLAPPNPYWITEYPGKTGPRWDDAEADVVFESQAKDFDKDIIRGRGAWRDNDNFVYHDGKNTWGETSGKYMYLTLRRNDIGLNCEPIDATTARDIAKNVMRISFETKTDAARCMAWAALAPFAGALKYRPSILITGPSGSGKSTVQREFIKKVTLCNTADTRDTTAAGIRLKTAKDSTCWLLDEAEKSTEKQKSNIDDILSFMRSNFSDDSPDAYKGTKDGGYINYKMNSMFGLAAIDPTIEKVADENRIFRINFIMPTRENQEKWEETSSNLKRLLTEENCKRIRAHTWKNLQKIEDMIKPVSKAIREKTGKRLRDSYADAYLLSAFIVVWEHNENPTEEEIKATIEKYYEFQTPNESRNEAEEWVDTLMDKIVEVLYDGGREKLTLRECLTIEYNGEKQDEEGEPIFLSQSIKRAYRETSGRHGLRLDKCGKVAVASNHPMIKTLMNINNGYSEILKRHPGWEKQVNGNFKNVLFPDKTQRQCTILNNVLTKKYNDMTDDEKIMNLI